MKVLGYVFYVIAALDIILSWLGIDITGVTWSPIIAVILGSIFVGMGIDSDDDCDE